MNHINYIVKGSVIKIFPESRWLSESSIVKDGITGDVKNNEGTAKG